MEIQQILLILLFFIVGLAMGSFALATAYRLKHKLDWVAGRSMCEHCKHELGTRDLVPLLSWLSSGGKCHYCKKRLSVLLPLSELLGGVVFALSYVALESAPVLLGIWLTALVLLFILFWYDVQWYTLPNKVVYPLIAVAAVFWITNILNKDNFSPVHLAVDIFGALVVASGLFYMIFTFSKGKWIGYGDVRLGWAIALLVGAPFQAALVLFTASLIGVVAVIPIAWLMTKKLPKILPFGPLLIIGTIIAVLYGAQIQDWYLHDLLFL